MYKHCNKLGQEGYGCEGLVVQSVFRAQLIWLLVAQYLQINLGSVDYGGESYVCPKTLDNYLIKVILSTNCLKDLPV